MAKPQIIHALKELFPEIKQIAHPVTGAMLRWSDCVLDEDAKGQPIVRMCITYDPHAMFDWLGDLRLKGEFCMMQLDMLELRVNRLLKKLGSPWRVTYEARPLFLAEIKDMCTDPIFEKGVD